MRQDESALSAYRITRTCVCGVCETVRDCNLVRRRRWSSMGEEERVRWELCAETVPRPARSGPRGSTIPPSCFSSQTSELWSRRSGQHARVARESLGVQAVGQEGY